MFVVDKSEELVKKISTRSKLITLNADLSLYLYIHLSLSLCFTSANSISASQLLLTFK